MFFGGKDRELGTCVCVCVVDGFFLRLGIWGHTDYDPAFLWA